METSVLSGKLFADMIKGGAAVLSLKKQVVNGLNVFPIPDGDTGDNMFMTIDSGYSALGNNCSDEDTLGEISQRVAHGMLLGARGNSGVILSRIFSGIAKGLSGITVADVKTFSQALLCGVDSAYGAVSVPVEGTILTVYKDAVLYANSRIDSNSTFESYLYDLGEEMKNSLQRTPELLDVLKAAGVVDSGGAGLVYITQGMTDAVCGKDFGQTAESEGVKTSKSIDLSLFGPDSELEFGYCTEFLLRLQNSKVDVDNFDIDMLREYLNSAGDSVVAFKDGSIVKVHVHTKTPGDILNHCQNYGEFLTLKIENMTLQHEETNAGDEMSSDAEIIEDGGIRLRTSVRKKYGIVSVGTGDGVKDMFVSLGCDAVVDGGQSMNPSTADFISAFDKVNADTIFVFPNNSNIILTANQAAQLYEKSDIKVFSTHSVGEGYAAISMLELESDNSVDEIIENANDTIASVVSGSVSVAIRDTEKNGFEIKKGSYIGFSDGVIYSNGETAEDALLSLACSLGAEKFDVLLLICGKDSDETRAKELYERLSKDFPGTEIIMSDGGQPVFDYMLLLE